MSGVAPGHAIAAVEEVAGRTFVDGDLLMMFSARLDETGRDGRSEYLTVGGAISTKDRWDLLETAWGRKLGAKRFHLDDFEAREADFAEWSDFKANRLEEALKKIIRENTVFRVAISVNSKAHLEIKNRMRGIKGFRADSDYGLCLRYLMFATCEQLVLIDPDCRLSMIVEDGPCAAGAAATYQKVAAMQGPWKPAKHAHRLAGFQSQPKGVLRSLEAADYIVGREHERLVAGGRARQRHSPVLAMLLTEEKLQTWYEGMLKEKEARRAYGTKASSS